MRMKNLIPWRERRPAELESDYPLFRIQKDMNRLFDEFWKDFDRPLARRLEREFTPVLDVAETDDAFLVTVELPGLSAEDVEVTVANDTLTVKGQKRSEHEEKKDNFYHMERSFGSFVRSVQLPVGLINEDEDRGAV